ncbi:hypothetical protein [Sinorhizobium sp. GL28]|uniref:hypothetical protein n=1 Tax=Sinorhizobium sp. GL28 TaxID=1358418 RepID=UPI0012E37B62|nr:hypothetical protein [Sinorhizobium sp. GL28]
MTNVFEVVDEAGAVRNYVAKFMRREADKLVVEYRGLRCGSQSRISATGAP